MAFSRGNRDASSRNRTAVASLPAALIAFAVFAAIAAPSALADPAVVVVTSPSEGATYTDSSSPPVLEFSSSGDIATQECKYDNTAYRNCDTLAAQGLRLTNGAHTYRIRTVDTTGVASLTVVNFVIDDNAAPVIGAAVAPNSLAVVEDPVTSPLGIDVTTDDSNARLYASIDDGGDQRLNFDGPTYRWSPAAITNGTHTAYFRAIDGAGQQSTAAVSFTLSDATAPVPLITSPAIDQIFVTDELRVEFTSDDPNGEYSCQLDAQAPQHCQADQSLLVPDISVGDHALTVYSQDNVGNTASMIVSFTVTDAATLGLSITEPMDGATYSAQPLLQLDLINPLQDFTLRCSVNGGKFGYCAEGEPIFEIDHNGSWTLTVRAIDENGDQVSDTASFTVNDTSAPQVSGTPPPGPINNATYFVPDFAVSDAFADSSASYLTSARCQLGSGVLMDCSTFFAFATGPNLLPGARTITMRVFDWVGNSSAATIAFTIADTTAPVVEILSPLNNFTAADASFTVDFSATGGAAKLRCQVGSAAQVPCAEGENDGVQSWSPVGLSSGVNTLSVHATDVAGNVGSATIDVTISDATGPSLSFISPAAGATISDIVSARVLSNEQIFKLRCAVDAAALTADEASCWISQSDPLTATFRPAALTSGVHTLWVEGSDQFGNTTTISRNIDVQDTTAPDLTIDGFNENAPDPTNDSPVSVSYWSNDSSAHFTCSVDGAAATACGSGGAGTLALAPTTDGGHSVTVAAYDASGNTTTKSSNYTVSDTTAPYLWIPDAYDGMAVGAAVTTHPEALGAVAFECAVDAAAFASCATSGWTANFAGSGAHTLRYRATDAKGNAAIETISVVATIPAPPVTPPVATPDLPPSPAPPAAPALPQAKASFAAIRPKVTKKIVTLPVNVFVGFPAGVSAVSACSGKATFTVTVGKKIVKQASSALKLVKGKCLVSGKLKIKSKLIAGKKFSAAVSFAGNATIAKFHSAKAGKSGRAR